MLYLDNAATSKRKPASVYASMAQNTIFNSVNAGRGGHSFSMGAMEKILEVQDLLTELFNIENPQNIAFTQNATYALNMAILGTLLQGGHAVVTEMEHNSVLRPINRLGNYTIVAADENGCIKPEDVRAAIKEDTKLIVCTHASNVCGSIEPVEKIGQIARDNGILFLVDAAQTAGCLDVDVKRIHADMLAFSGHKGLMGPLGTGGLYVRRPELLEAVITGGTGSKSESLVQPHIMPDMLHSGTMNTPAIAALGEGVKFVLREGAAAIGQKERELSQRLSEKLMNIPEITLYGTDERTGIVAFNLYKKTSDETAALITDKMAVRSGYHCAPLAHHALGTEKTGVVRVSFGAFNTTKDADRAADIIYRASRQG